MNKINILKKKIKNKEAKIGVIGLGYVGLPLVIEFLKKIFTFLVLIMILIKLIN